jgi:hypothetical protein
MECPVCPSVDLLQSQCIAMSLSELASRFPTAAGPYYWAFQIWKGRGRAALSFFTGWAFLVSVHSGDLRCTPADFLNQMV